MSRPRQFSIRPGLLAVLTLLSILLIISHYRGEENAAETAVGDGTSQADVRFLDVRFEEPQGMSIGLDATEHDAAELRDAYLITPVSLSFRMNAEFHIRLTGVPLGSTPDAELVAVLSTQPCPEPLTADFFRKTTVRVRIDERDRMHLSNGTGVSLVYYLPSGSDEPHSDDYVPLEAPHDDGPVEFEHGILIAVLRLKRSDTDAHDFVTPGQPDTPAIVQRLCPIEG